jgi:hypothetical protein
MNKINKAIAAAAGGGLAGGVTGVMLLPEGSPWYAYVLMAAVTTLLPAIVTYLAPKNAD